MNYQTSELASFLLLALNELFGGGTTPAEQPGINAFVQENLLEDDGSLTLDIGDALNFTDVLNATDMVNITNDGIVVLDEHNNLTEAKIVIQSVKVLGLDSFTSFGPFEAIGNYTLRTAASLSNIRVEIMFSLELRPSTLPESMHTNPNAPPLLAENARIVFGADDMEATLSALLGIDETVAINAVNNPDNLVNCLLGSVVRVETSSVSLTVGSLPEPTLTGISTGLDRIATQTAQAIWIMYEASLLRSMQELIQQSLSNVLLPIDQLVTSSTTCEEEAAPLPLPTSAVPSSAPSPVPSSVPSPVPFPSSSVTRLSLWLSMIICYLVVSLTVHI